MATRLSQLLLPDLITLQVRSVKRTEAINEVARLLAKHPELGNFEAFNAELLARERLDTTCLGNEIALPHARTDHVKSIVLAVGRSDAGVRFDENQTARLLFVLGTPKSNPSGYLQVVSSLCKVLKDQETRTALMQAQTPEAFIEVIVQAESRIEVPTAAPAKIKA
jgi:mannitol/fructose-specific phosphotransferase system IIA component (Ntr-type)